MKLCSGSSLSCDVGNFKVKRSMSSSIKNVEGSSVSSFLSDFRIPHRNESLFLSSGNGTFHKSGLRGIVEDTVPVYCS